MFFSAYPCIAIPIILIQSKFNERCFSLYQLLGELELVWFQSRFRRDLNVGFRLDFDGFVPHVFFALTNPTHISNIPSHQHLAWGPGPQWASSCGPSQQQVKINLLQRIIHVWHSSIQVNAVELFYMQESSSDLHCTILIDWGVSNHIELLWKQKALPITSTKRPALKLEALRWAIIVEAVAMVMTKWICALPT
jgi:hypothetical protein